MTFMPLGFTDLVCNHFCLWSPKVLSLVMLSAGMEFFFLNFCIFLKFYIILRLKSRCPWTQVSANKQQTLMPLKITLTEIKWVLSAHYSASQKTFYTHIDFCMKIFLPTFSSQSVFPASLRCQHDLKTCLQNVSSWFAIFFEKSINHSYRAGSDWD